MGIEPSPVADRPFCFFYPATLSFSQLFLIYHPDFTKPLRYLILRFFFISTPDCKISIIVDCGQSSLISVTLPPSRLPSWRKTVQWFIRKIGFRQINCNQYRHRTPPVRVTNENHKSLLLYSTENTFNFAFLELKNRRNLGNVSVVKSVNCAFGFIS